MENTDYMNEEMAQPIHTGEEPLFNENQREQMSQACSYLISISKWMKFFFIMAIISVSLIMMAGLAIIASASIISDMPDIPDFPVAIVGAIYMAVGALNLVPAIYMNRISKAAERTVESDDNNAMLDFLKNNKSLWKFLGILTIVMIGFSILILPIIFLFASFAGL
ncbi:MAG: hypothetical protein II899_06185 [Bacteroidales bacterium]|nr:hypothetical protein [Bacteroidales bacterium]